VNLKTKYLNYNNGLPYYQRVVPPALQHRFKQRVIKIPLRQELSIEEQKQGVSIELSLLGQINQLRKTHSELFESAINNPQLSTALTTGINKPIQPKELMLSEALSIYLANHQRGRDKKFIAYTLYKWNTFMRIIGDMPLVQLSRTHAKQYRDQRLSEKVKTTTIKRELKNISAIIKKTFLEVDLDKTNPISNIEIPGLGNDSIKREPFTHDEFTLLVQSCLKRNDSKRRILLIAAFTGMRLGEVIGLRHSDINVRDQVDQVSYLSIKPHACRRLKTKGSARDVPMIEPLLGIVKLQIECSKDSTYLFPEYVTETQVLSNTASATLNQYIKNLGINKSIHCLRHFMRDALREAGITKDLIDSIGGWSSGDIGNLYGMGNSLKMKLEALNLGYRAYIAMK